MQSQVIPTDFDARPVLVQVGPRVSVQVGPRVSVQVGPRVSVQVGPRVIPIASDATACNFSFWLDLIYPKPIFAHTQQNAKNTFFYKPLAGFTKKNIYLIFF